MIYSNKYGRYSVPNHNTSCANRIRSGQVYEERTIQYIINNCKHKSVVHAGAYFGDFLPALSKHTHGTIYSFEPNTDNYNHAKKTIEINNLDNVVLKNLALSYGDETYHLKYKKEDGNFLGGGSHITGKYDSVKDGHQKIESVALDSFSLTDISIIHLDVEAHEEQALMGAIETIRRNMPILIVENKPSAYFFDTYLTPLGYSYLPNKIELNFVIRHG